MRNFRVCFLIFFMMFITFSAWADSPAVPEKQPAISVQEPVYTFPDVLDGQKVVHDFIVKNTGDAVLKIEAVDTT